MGNMDLDKRAIWVPLLEKAWSKIKGSYLGSDGGFIQNGIRSLAGCPVFTYFTTDQNETDTWNMLKAYDEAHGSYLLGAATVGSDTSRNSFGVANGHAFTILSVFSLRDKFGAEEYQLYMIRNPWSNTYYSGDFHYRDSKWTDHRKS